MINNDNYMNFIADPKFPEGNRDEDLYFLFQDKMILWERCLFQLLRILKI